MRQVVASVPLRETKPERLGWYRDKEAAQHRSLRPTGAKGGAKHGPQAPT